MDILNRVLLIILVLLVVAASLAGILIAFKAVSPAKIQSIIPFERVVGFFKTNPVASSLVSILILVVVMSLSILWLRGQYSEVVRAAAGGQYEVGGHGSGFILVDYNVVEKSVDYLIGGIPGVIKTSTKIYSQRDGELFAHSSLLTKRDADIRTIDGKIREAINREWLDKLGIELARHDITISIETATERRVA